MKKELKNRGGITLIALVITIIILLILAGVTISLVLNGGIIGQAQNAKAVTELEQEKEGLQLRVAELEIELYKISDKNSQEYINKSRELIEVKNEILLKTITSNKVDPYYIYNQVGWDAFGAYLENLMKLETGASPVGACNYSSALGWHGDYSFLPQSLLVAFETVLTADIPWMVEIGGWYGDSYCDISIKIETGTWTDQSNLGGAPGEWAVPEVSMYFKTDSTGDISLLRCVNLWLGMDF